MINYYDSAKKYYERGYYKETHLKVFVQAGKITAAQYKVITGKDYTEAD